MSCKHHKNALVEAAASGAGPQSELRAHLGACADCRTLFEQEQALFSSIDAGLHSAANAEVPVSLLPRVRTGLDAEVASTRSLSTNWLVLASAAAIIAAIFVARGVWHLDVRQHPPANLARTNPSVRVLPPAQEQSKTPELSADITSHTRTQVFSARGSRSPGSQTVRSSMPEILVPHDQETLLAEYAAQWQQQKRAPLLTQDADATRLVPLQVAQIQIAELDVKLLADEKSQ
jgi:hypothetical protein